MSDISGKYWTELTDDEKLEALRMAVVWSIDRLNGIAYRSFGTPVNLLDKPEIFDNEQETVE